MKLTPRHPAGDRVPSSGAPEIAAVIPCYKVRDLVLSVIAGIGPEVSSIFVVDDACPEESGRHIAEHCDDPRVRVLYSTNSGGGGGAVIKVDRGAIAGGGAIVVKIGGDGKMAPVFICRLVAQIQGGFADYTKGIPLSRGSPPWRPTPLS